MKEVIRISEINEMKKEKPVELTGCLQSDGEIYEYDNFSTHKYKTILYLGNNEYHGDMFAAYTDEAGSDPVIFKGHLNSGKY